MDGLDEKYGSVTGLSGREVSIWVNGWTGREIWIGDWIKWEGSEYLGDRMDKGSWTRSKTTQL